MRTIEELLEDVEKLSGWRGDNECHHAECDEAAYDLLTLLCAGEQPDKVREAAEHVLDEINWQEEMPDDVNERYQRQWWYS